MSMIYELLHEKTDNSHMRNKGADQLRSYCEADQRLFFATRIVHVILFFNPKFHATSLLVTVQTGHKKERKDDTPFGLSLV